MKIAYTTYLIIVFFLCKETLEAPSLVIIVSAIVAGLTRVLWEIDNRVKNKLTLAKIGVIILTSLFFPYAASLALSKYEFLDGWTILILFAIGLTSVDATDYLIKNIPSIFDKLKTWGLDKLTNKK